MYVCMYVYIYMYMYRYNENLNHFNSLYPGSYEIFHRERNCVSKFSSNHFAVFQKNVLIPSDTGRKLNSQKTFRIRPGTLLNVLCTFNLCSVSKRKVFCSTSTGGGGDKKRKL